MKSEIAVPLQQVLVDTYALYLKTQSAHWNVSGPHFNSLHEMFQQQYEDMAEAIDEIAERIRQKDVFVPASLSLFGKITKVEESTDVMNSEEIVNDLIKSHSEVIDSINKAVEVAKENEDEGTLDMLVGRLKVHDKAVWMLKMVNTDESIKESKRTLKQGRKSSLSNVLGV